MRSSKHWEIANETVSHPRRLESSVTPTREPQISQDYEDRDGKLPQNTERYNLDERTHSEHSESQLRTDPAATPCTNAAAVGAALVT
jgi:hypothetical protein